MIAAAAATAAPALMPRIAGSASGLRVSPCSNAPVRPSATPTISPISVRGTRSSRTVVWSWLPASGLVSASATTPSGIEREPTARLSRQTSTSTPAAASSPSARAERRRARPRARGRAPSVVVTGRDGPSAVTGVATVRAP